MNQYIYFFFSYIWPSANYGHHTVVHTHGANLTHQKLLPKKHQKLKPANVIKPQRKAVCIYLQTFLRHFKTIPFPNQYFYTNVFKTVQRRLICIFNVSPNKLLMQWHQKKQDILNSLRLIYWHQTTCNDCVYILHAYWICVYLSVCSIIIYVNICCIKPFLNPLLKFEKGKSFKRSSLILFKNFHGNSLHLNSPKSPIIWPF